MTEYGDPPPIVPVIATQNPDTGTEFGGVDGLIPPPSVHDPSAEELYLINRNNLRRSRRASQWPYPEQST